MTDNVTNFLASGIEIKGTIRFQNDMHIDGKIEGEITSDRCELKQQARVVGDMKTRSLAMEEGAHLLGRTEIG